MPDIFEMGYGGAGKALTVLGGEGDCFLARAYIAVTGSTAADAAVFSMYNLLGLRTAKLLYVTGSLMFTGTSATGTAQGFYFDRYRGKPASGGTTITVCRREMSGRTTIGDCRFHTGALTGTLGYDAAPFGGKVIACIDGSTDDFYLPFGQRGFSLGPEEGLALRLTAQSVTGLFIDLTVMWSEA